MSDELIAARDFSSRAFVLEDMTIRSDGSGRTVEAYAAAFNVRAEIKDADGHYYEELDPASFNRTIAHNGLNFGVFYNHARTIYGTPDGSLSVPIGTPEQVRADERGVWTVTRYLDNPLADAVLDGIKQRAIKGQSFSGRFIKSARSRGARGALPVIRRTEVAMREYGPTVFPAYAEAAIVGTRSVASFLTEIESLSEEDRDKFRQMLGIATPLEDSTTPSDTASATVPADDPAIFGHSARHLHTTIRARARREGGPLS